MREVAWARLQGPVTSVLQYTLVSRVGPGCSAALCTTESRRLLLFSCLLLYLYQLFKLVALVCQYVCSSFTVRVYLSTNISVFESRQSHGALALTLCGGSAQPLSGCAACGPHSRGRAWRWDV